MPISQERKERDKTRATRWYHGEKHNELFEGYPWSVGVLEKTYQVGAELFRFFENEPCHAGLGCPNCNGTPSRGDVGFVVNGRFDQLHSGVILKKNGGRVESSSYTDDGKDLVYEWL